MKQNTTQGMKSTSTLALIAALLVLTIITQAHAALQPNVIVKGFHVQDGEAIVGKTFTLAVTLANNEPAACAQAITTTLQAGAPFIMDGISTLPAGNLCYGETKTVLFPMKIDPTATGGFYQLTITNAYETTLLTQYTNANTINVFVKGTPQLDAHIVNSNPLDVYPGDTASVTIAIQNTGAFKAQNVGATLDAKKPLDVKWSRSFSPLGTIDAKQTKYAEFSIEVPKTAQARDYSVTLTLTYDDENLAEQTMSVPLTFHVREKAQFATIDAGSDNLFANENDRVVRLTLKNTGTDDAHKVKVKIQPQFPFSTDGSMRYIEVLPAGGSAAVDLVLNIDKDAMLGTYGIDALIDFEDAQGKKLQDTAKISLVVEKKGLLQAVFLDYWFLWLVLVLVVVVIRRKKMKAKAAASGSKKK